MRPKGCPVKGSDVFLQGPNLRNWGLRDLDKKRDKRSPHLILHLWRRGLELYKNHFYALEKFEMSMKEMLCITDKTTHISRPPRPQFLKLGRSFMGSARPMNLIIFGWYFRGQWFFVNNRLLPVSPRERGQAGRRTSKTAPPV